MVNRPLAATAFRWSPRSVLGILTDLGSQIKVPDVYVSSGANQADHWPDWRRGTRPTIHRQCRAEGAQGRLYRHFYGPLKYWIDRNDFDSKYAFTIVQNLMALAESNQDAKTPIVTIPAN